jgi:hypothetical protein
MAQMAVPRHTRSFELRHDIRASIRSRQASRAGGSSVSSFRFVAPKRVRRPVNRGTSQGFEPDTPQREACGTEETSDFLGRVHRFVIWRLRTRIPCSTSTELFVPDLAGQRRWVLGPRGHTDGPSAPQHALDLGKGRGRIRHMEEDKRQHGDVEHAGSDPVWRRSVARPAIDRLLPPDLQSRPLVAEWLAFLAERLAAEAIQEFTDRGSLE